MSNLKSSAVTGHAGGSVCGGARRLAGMLRLLALIFCSLSGRAEPALVLDENSSWRRLYRFDVDRVSPAALRTDGERILGAKRLDGLKQDSERVMRNRGLDPARADWRDYARLAPQGARATNPVPAPLPPDDWMKADFDDASWVRLEHPFQGGSAAQITTPNLGQYGEAVDLKLQQAFYRARFVISDPQAVPDLTVEVTYNGGARVFVNGEEVARGHLPQGGLAPETPGEDYPVQAYGANAAVRPERSLGPVSLPPRLLRKGVNVLAIEVRASAFHPIVLTNPIQPNWGGPMRPFPHARLGRVKLRSASRAIASSLQRPAGVQVWAEDMHHRTLSTHFLPPGELPGTVRLVAPRNGICSAQVVVGADKPLARLSVQTGDLRQAGGAGKIPAAAVQVLYAVPYPLDQWTLAKLGDERGLGASFPSNPQLAGYVAASTGPQVFDRLTPVAPGSLPAGACRSVWLSLRVPRGAPPGAYRGAVDVAADGMSPVSVPVDLEVVDWAVPDAKDFRTFVGCEENPYAVARQYGVPPWSDAHFRLLVASFRQLGRAGNAWLNVPIIRRTEFGNAEDSPVRWIRKRDGSLDFDFSVLDRYLDLAVGQWGRLKVIHFIVMHGMPGRTGVPADGSVNVADEGGGPGARLPLTGATAQSSWTAFGKAVHAHMKSRQLDACMYWGAPLEGEADPNLKTWLAACAPGVYWTAGPHEMMYNGTFAKNETFYHLVADIRYQGGWPSFRDDMGWKSRTLHLLNPRVGGTAFALHTTSHPFAYRTLPKRALTLGRGGFTRVGADEWAATHYDDMEIPKWLTGMPVLFVLWPGTDGAESSMRYEALLEGIQETEARIFVEQALDRGSVRGSLADRVRTILADDVSETAFFQGNSLIHSMEEYSYRWQERARALYRAAADVAAAPGQ